MKKIFALCATGLLALMFTGCFEVKESYTIREDGTGTIVQDIEMGKMFEMIQAMAGDKEDLKKDPDLSKKIDTVFGFAGFADTSTAVPAAYKSMIAQGTMGLKMDIEKNLFNIKLSFPYSNLELLNDYFDPEKSETFGLAIENAFKGMEGKAPSLLGGNEFGAEEEEKEVEEEEEKGEKKSGMFSDLDRMKSFYITSVNKEGIKRTVKEGAIAVLKSQEMQQASGMIEMMGGMNVTTSFSLPRPAKKVEGKKAVLSADKKTLTVTYSLSEVLTDPQAGAFSVEY